MDFINLSLEDMQIFVEVCDSSSFSEAAQKIYLSRQSVARSVDNLEEKLGMELIMRTSSGIMPTKAGAEFCACCREIIKNVRNTVSHMEEYKRKASREINFGFLGYINSTRIVMRTVRQFMSDHPGIQINPVDLSQMNIPEAVMKRTVDFAFANLDVNARDEDLCGIPLEDEEYVLITKKDSDLASLSAVTPKDISGKKINFVSRYSIAVQIFENWMAPGTDYEIINAGDYGFLSTSVREDSHVALLLQSNCRVLLASNPDLVAMHLSPPMTRHSGIIYRKNMLFSEAQREFLDYFCQAHRHAVEQIKKEQDAIFC